MAAEPGALRTPRVLDVDDGYLALEWIAPGRLSGEGEQELGRGLAATHAAGHLASAASARARPDDRSVWRTGRRRVAWPAAPAQRADRDWPSFYAERRLPAARLAREHDALARLGWTRWSACASGSASSPGPPSRPRGCTATCGRQRAGRRDGRPWLVDPFAYGGHREMDLAMLRLFGSPSECLLAGYLELAPLAEGWEERVGLYQLFPLLVHALLFAAPIATRRSAWRLRYGRLTRVATRERRHATGRPADERRQSAMCDGGASRRGEWSDWEDVHPQTLARDVGSTCSRGWSSARHYRRPRDLGGRGTRAVELAAPAAARLRAVSAS